MTTNEQTVIELGKKIYVLDYTPFDESINLDELTNVHYDNIVGEFITVATLMNKVGILKAECDNLYREKSLNHKILEARKAESYRKSLMSVEEGSKAKSPTVAQIENAVTIDQEVIDSKMDLFKYQKQAEIIDSLYWAVKAKATKINNLSSNITPEEFQNEIIEGKINGIMVKKMKKNF